MHPLTQDLTALKDEELHTKVAELNKRLTQCYKVGPTQLIPQIQMVLGDYNAEVGRRNAKLMDEVTKKNDKGNKGFSTIIDIQ
jgi:protein-arginine kinase activator protein McsA